MSIQLIDCPACGSKVSLQAVACPHCGQPIRSISPTLVSVVSVDVRSVRSEWSAFKPSGDGTCGPFATVRLSNINLTEDAVLQRIRSAFERNGFSVKKTNVRVGTARTVGFFSGGTIGGLVGGITSIDQETWNPFLISTPRCKFVYAEVAVLYVRQRTRALDATCSAAEQDIELRIETRQRCDALSFLTALGVVAAPLAGVFCTVLLLQLFGDSTYIYVLGVFFTFIPGFLASKIPELYWSRSNINRFTNAVDRVVDSLAGKLK